MTNNNVSPAAKRTIKALMMLLEILAGSQSPVVSKLAIAQRKAWADILADESEEYTEKIEQAHAIVEDKVSERTRINKKLIASLDDTRIGVTVERSKGNKGAITKVTVDNPNEENTYYFYVWEAPPRGLIGEFSMKGSDLASVLYVSKQGYMSAKPQKFFKVIEGQEPLADWDEGDDEE